MGIPGLTTFIQNRSHLYMEKYELHDTNVIIDGNAVACQLYKWHCKSNDCFGGDYDKFAHVITNFFRILSECNVTPYVIFDGGYEARKLKTVISRMKNKVKSAELLNSATEGSISVFPLFLRETFRDIVLKQNIKCVQCDFESDAETASIARSLNCPVISYDSDFFIFDVLYIPFSTVEMSVKKKKKPNHKETYNYINCEIYKVDKFLYQFGGMDKSNLPILAVLLGNDYIKRSQFSLFYDHLKMQKSYGNQSEQQKRIKSLIVWLQNETVETAIKKVLSRYKHQKRKRISENIKDAIKGYNHNDSEYLKYLGVTHATSTTTQEIDLDNIVIDVDGDNMSEVQTDEEEEDEVNSDSEDRENIDEEILNVASKLKQDVPAVFQENFRKCLYPPSFMDILLHNRYYCIPQVENMSLEYSHSICSDILNVIHKILTNANNQLISIARNTHGNVKRNFLPECQLNVPSLTEIQNMDLDVRKIRLLEVLKMNEPSFTNCLSLFPEPWHLFIITLNYLINKSILTWPLIYSLVLCKLVLTYVDTNIGFYRSTKIFEKKFGVAIINNTANNKNEAEIFTIPQALEDISYNDSLFCLKSLLPYFQMDTKMQISNRLFNRSLVHSMAQFQSCFLHTKYLNSLFNLPFPDFIISEFFNGTLVYNLTTNFIKRTNLDDYMKIFLQNSPSVRNSLNLITDKLKEHCNIDNVVVTKVSKRRKKKKIQEAYVSESDENLSEPEFVFDPNNKFSLLSIT